MTNFLVGIFEMLRELVAGVTGAELSYGVTIILLTLLVKLALMPLTIKQTKSTKKMNEIQPKIKKIQERYKNDPERLQKETMKIYQESGVNPLASCLPLLIQFPILIALYRVFYEIEGIAGMSFLWIQDLGASFFDVFSTGDVGAILIAAILPVASAATMFLSTYLSSPTDDNGKKQNMNMNIGMTAFIAWIGLGLQSSLLLYWTVSNALQLIQTLTIKSDKATAK